MSVVDFTKSNTAENAERFLNRSFVVLVACWGPNEMSDRKSSAFLEKIQTTDRYGLETTNIPWPFGSIDMNTNTPVIDTICFYYNAFRKKTTISDNLGTCKTSSRHVDLTQQRGVFYLFFAGKFLFSFGNMDILRLYLRKNSGDFKLLALLTYYTSGLWTLGFLFVQIWYSLI